MRSFVCVLADELHTELRISGTRLNHGTVLFSLFSEQHFVCVTSPLPTQPLPLRQPAHGAELLVAPPILFWVSLLRSLSTAGADSSRGLMQESNKLVHNYGFRFVMFICTTQVAYSTKTGEQLKQDVSPLQNLYEKYTKQLIIKIMIIKKVFLDLLISAKPETHSHCPLVIIGNVLCPAFSLS